MSLAKAETVPAPPPLRHFQPGPLCTHRNRDHSLLTQTATAKATSTSLVSQAGPPTYRGPKPHALRFESFASAPVKYDDDDNSHCAHAFSANNEVNFSALKEDIAPTISPFALRPACTPPKPYPINNETCIAVVGVGYVGTSLLHQLASPFPRAIGYDVSAERIKELRNSDLKTGDKGMSNIVLTSDPCELKRASYFLIAVPTLLRHQKRYGSDCETDNPSGVVLQNHVDLDYVQSAIDVVLQHCRAGSVVVLESSVSVGATRSLLGRYGAFVHGGMSPERVDPGRESPAPAEIPKLVAGLTPDAAVAITALYSRFYQRVVTVSSPEVAEMTKLYENCFRMVNIAYANEIADACRGRGINFQEVLAAATTKPYGFMPFSAGLGVGGHCIPVNPYYLFSSCKKGALPVLERATKTMSQRPRKLAKSFHRRVMLEMAKGKGTAVGEVMTRTRPRILVVGIGFKPGERALSYSPGLAFAAALKEMGSRDVAFYDPLVEVDALGEDMQWLGKLPHEEWQLDHLELAFDGIAVCSRQRGVDWSVIQRRRARQGCFVRWFA